MIFITSISPVHINKDIQSKCIDSWIELGGTVISINSKKECTELKEKYPQVQFYSTTRTLEKTYGKPLVQLSAIIDICKELEYDNYCIINSDIELKSDKQTIERIEVEMLNNIVLSNRINHNGDYIGPKYLAGIDVFFIHRRFLDSFPQTMNAIGMTFVDYFIPYAAAMNNIQTMFIKQNFAYHLNHNAQYSMDNWKKSGRYFMWEFNLAQFHPYKDVGKMSDFIYSYIYNYSITKEI